MVVGELAAVVAAAVVPAVAAVVLLAYAASDRPPVPSDPVAVPSLASLDTVAGVVAAPVDAAEGPDVDVYAFPRQVVRHRTTAAAALADAGVCTSAVAAVVVA